MLEAEVKLKIVTIGSAASASFAVMLGAFCWWGLFTEGGSRYFDEMAGLIPFYAGVAGALALLLSIGLLVWRSSLVQRD
jgi:hypothetical protein